MRSPSRPTRSSRGNEAGSPASLLTSAATLGACLRSCLVGTIILAASALAARAELRDFNLPAQSAAPALLEFSRQSKIDVLFSFDALRRERSTAVVGRFEPADALDRLLLGTRFRARPNGAGRFVVAPITLADPAPAPAPQRESGALTQAPPIEPSRLAPFLVQSHRDRASAFDRSAVQLPPRTAVGNLDLPRSQIDALPFQILERTRLARSGVVNLNDFLRRELLDSNPAKLPPEQSGGDPGYVASSVNLALRGFSNADETIIMVNGRRLPEILTSGSDGQPRMPDVNFIPLSLVQQIEVLPVSAASLYNGNPVGGVINIVLRPAADMNVTETAFTYTNALRGYDAPQSSLSLTHLRSLLGGALRVSLNASTTRTLPPTESELGHHQSRINPQYPADWPLYRATPNIRSADRSPLLASGPSIAASVAPGADGRGGLAALAPRVGLRNFALFDAPGGFATSIDSSDYLYGRRQRRDALFGSAIYDATPWLQIGLDGTLARTIVHRGHDLLWADLDLAATHPLNPFGRDVKVSLNDVAARLGENYNESRLQFASAVLGLLFQLPREWRASFDTQFAHNLTQHRGLADVDRDRWQQLVDEGKYNPLRDTQRFPAPAEFYDRVLIYRGGLNRFVTLGDYGALDASFRVLNEALPLPTGRGALNFGADYRRTYLAKYREAPRYADGSPAADSVEWSGRTLQRYSVFGELRGPVAPESRLPSWLRKLEADLAVRYIAANSGRESYVAPTASFKADFRGGVSFRSSFTTSNRYPTPQMSRQVFALADGPGPGLYYESIKDPRRGGAGYNVVSNEVISPVLAPEAVVTQAAGLVFQHGRAHRVRATLDFVDTRKTNELVYLDAQSLVDLEHHFPERVARAPGEGALPGRVVSVLRGTVNQAWRHSQNWNATADYAWTECLGGTFDLYGRLLVFERYKLERVTGSGVVNALYHPDINDLQLLRYRANFGASWSNHDRALGVDGHYYHSRKLPVAFWPIQGHRQIRPFWQFDAYVQEDIARHLPWFRDGRALKLQLRVNNLFRSGYPINRIEPSGIQPYGDWRDRTYSLSLTATF